MTNDSTEEQKEYIYQRQWKSSMRLNYAHHLVKEVFGYTLHPSIPTSGSSSLRIADLGAGTGVWALEIASRLKESGAQVDGFDISADQYPAPCFRPPNIQFHVHDCFKPFPKELQGQFDVVNARFWLCIVNDPTARPLLRNFLTLLKPGGYLQWTESVALSAKLFAPNPAAPTQAMERVVKSWHKPQPHSELHWVENLPKLYGEEGMIDIVRDQRDWPDHLRPLWMQASFAAMEDTIPSVSVVNEEAEGTRRLIGQMVQELEQGVAIATDLICVVGRKSGK